MDRKSEENLTGKIIPWGWSPIVTGGTEATPEYVKNVLIDPERVQADGDIHLGFNISRVFQLKE